MSGNMKNTYMLRKCKPYIPEIIFVQLDSHSVSMRNTPPSRYIISFFVLYCPLRFVVSISIITAPTICRLNFNVITCFFFYHLNGRSFHATEILICDDHIKKKYSIDHTSI